MNTKEELKATLQAFKELTNKLSTQWEKLQLEENDSDLGTSNYCFEKSFDEIQIKTWVDSFIKQLSEPTFYYASTIFHCVVVRATSENEALKKACEQLTKITLQDVIRDDIRTLRDAKEDEIDLHFNPRY